SKKVASCPLFLTKLLQKCYKIFQWPEISDQKPTFLTKSDQKFLLNSSAHFRPVQLSKLSRTRPGLTENTIAHQSSLVPTGSQNTAEEQTCNAADDHEYGFAAGGKAVGSAGAKAVALSGTAFVRKSEIPY
ncbi:MAG: hypothetical protein LUC21_06565, partial [Oscillospiraceae bacterium]|nr:hypothetical protein [Oscillospiraceae bacterium]